MTHEDISTLYDFESERLIIGAALHTPETSRLITSALTLNDFGQTDSRFVFPTLIQLPTHTKILKSTDPTLAELRVKRAAELSGLSELRVHQMWADAFDDSPSRLSTHMKNIREISNRRTAYFAIQAATVALNEGSRGEQVALDRLQDATFALRSNARLSQDFSEEGIGR
jgi:replicative DNA helicase